MTVERSSGRSGGGATALAAAVLATLLGVAGAGGGGGTPAALAAADPFYLDLLRDGIQSYDRADYAAAAKQLRLACFGMLDEPEALAACLTRLGLAQAAAGDADAFRETFRRIVEVEDRFGAYAKADLPPAVRAAFEQRVLAAVPAGTLEAIAAWRPLLNRKLESQIAGLPPRERRHQLEERLGKEPKSVPWNVLLAELDVEEGQTASALSRAEATVALAPQDPWALCVRGLARSAANRCREALADLEPCALASPSADGATAAGAPPAGSSKSSRGAGRSGSPAASGSARDGAGDVRYAAALLGCRVELAQWRQAEEQVKALPSGFRQDRKMAALIQQVAKHPSAPATPSGRGSGATAPSAAVADPGSGAAATGGAGGKGSAATAGSGGQTGLKAPANAARPTAPANTAPASGTAGTAGTAAAAGANTRPGSPPAAAAAGGGSRAGAAPAAAPGGAGSGEAPRAPASAAATPPAGSRPAAPMSAAEREAMARSEKLLTATAIPDLREALRLARQLADAHPDSKEAQYLAGEAAYRNSRWTEAAAYFRRGGPPGDDHPELLFYMAVAFYEVGDQPGAATALRRSLPNLQKTPFVESYVKRILGQ